MVNLARYQGLEFGLKMESKRRTKHRKRISIVSLTGILLIAGVLLGLYVGKWRTERLVKRSATDILVLAHAVRVRTLDYGPWSMYPDFAYESVESRRKYGINTEMPQDMVDRLGQIGPDVSSIHNEVQTTAWKHDWADFELRLRRWEFFLWPVPQFLISDLSVRGGLTDVEINRRLQTEANITGKEFREYNLSRARQMKIPIDPFSSPEGDHLYHYGKPLYKGPKDNTGAYAMWIIAGNGPDGDVDIDVSMFDITVATTDTVRGVRSVYPDLGFDRNPIELLYDPTNGTKSDGDLMLFSKSLFFNRQLCDPEIFEKRYR